MANNHPGYIFPGHADYQPLGVVAGDDLPPNYSSSPDGIMEDGFESGDTGAWSAASP